ncbi:hypothetical protein MRX96_016285 [Rhipicephalus microplus]|uniref:Protein ovary overexpressed n=1 Tax=Rhipicephalus microplus TaxID=6941 RepID=A0A6M2CX23_RHIMP
MSRRVALADAILEAARSTRASEQSCLCNRPMTVVFCGTCCCSFKGRVQRSCGEHPKVIHLMDTDKCPKCYSDNLIERTPSGRQ